MKIQALSIDGCFEIEHEVFTDERGVFREWFKTDELEREGIIFKVSQANLSKSNQGVIRGMHYSLAPIGQSKLVTCVEGQILDVLIDIRIGSPTFMKQEKIKLSGAEGRCILISTGVAHGFLAQQDNSTVSYLLSSEYDRDNEKTIHPLDVDFQIDWGRPESTSFVLSERDRMAPTFKQAKNNKEIPRFGKA